MPDESTILRFRHLLEHKLADQILALVNALLSDKGLLLKAGTVVDATRKAREVLTKGSPRVPSDAESRGARRLPVHSSAKAQRNSH